MQIFMNTQTFKYFQEISYEYILANPSSSLSTFLNDLPLLQDQKWSFHTNRPKAHIGAVVARRVELSSQSIKAYISIAEQHQMLVPESQERTISIVLENIFRGVIIPELFPTTYISTLAYSRVVVSEKGFHGLQDVAAPLHPSEYLNQLALFNVQLIDTKPSFTTVGEGSRIGFEMNVPISPLLPRRDMPMMLKIPIDYLAEQATLHNLHSRKVDTPLIKATLTMEHIGLEWLSAPQFDIITQLTQ